MTISFTGERLAQLEEELAARLDPLDIPQRHVDAYVAHTEMIVARILTIRSATLTLAEVVPRIAAETAWLDFLTTSRKTLCDELLALPPRIRSDRDMGTRQNLMLSITTIDRGLVSEDTGFALNSLRLGQLMREAGYVESTRIENQMVGRLPWFGSVPEVEHRLKALQQRRDEAQAALDAALLDEAERERLAAEDKARYDVRNAAPQRKTRGDGSQYDRYPDGRVVEVTA